METRTVRTTAELRIALGQDAVDGLARAFRGELIGPDDPGYEQARRVWNGPLEKGEKAIRPLGRIVTLLAVKAKYDPDNLFHGALNIVPRP